MKKVFKFLALGLLLLSQFLAPATCFAQRDNSLKRVEAKGKLTIAASGTLYPIAFHNDQNKLEGYSIEIMREVAKGMGVQLEVKEMGVDGMWTSLDNGQVDVVAEGFDITPEREKKYRFSTPIIYSMGTAVVRSKDNSGIKKLEDFKGKKAAGAATTVYMKIAKKLGAKPVIYDNSSNEQYMMDLTAKRTDFIPNDYYTIKSALAFYGDKYDIKIANIFYNPSKSALLLAKKDVKLANRINQELKKLRESGRLTELAKKYYNGDNPSEPLKEFNGQALKNIPVVDYSK